MQAAWETVTSSSCGGVMRIRQRIVRMFTERPDDPLPLEWIAGACVASVGAFTWGWLLGSWGFFQNVLASIALLGPGLFLTNVVARNWRFSIAAKGKRAGLTD